MVKFRILSLISVILSLSSVEGNSAEEDVFSSVAKMEGLVVQEGNIVELLESYLRDAKTRLNVIENYIAAYREVSGVASSSVVANPVDAYLVVKRLTIDWDVIESVLRTETNATKGALNRVQQLRESTEFPGTEDLHGAAVALVRLQDTYCLNVTQLADGYFSGVDQSKSHVFRSRRDLSGRDCLFLAQHAFARGYYDTALQWAETAIIRASVSQQEEDPEENGKLRDEVKRFLQMAAQVHDDVLELQGPRGAQWQTNPYPVNSRLKNAHLDKYGSLAEYKFVPKLYQLQTEEEETEHYERLCRGEKLRSPRVEARLRCRLIHRNEPYLRLQPLKIEEQSLDPSIVVIHDLLTDRQAELFQELAKPKLHTSRHKSEKGGFVRSLIRTSKNAWLLENEHPSLPAIRRRMEIATGLLVGAETAAEHFQIANYGIGGLYVTHTDNVIHEDKPTPWDVIVGDRIATLMVYLTDVEAGGATVFPQAGVSLWPRKGSAAFWWNLYRSGVADRATRHGACPVLHGSKWVSNKWIRQYDQMFRATCGLYPLDKFTLL